jgi:DNA repair ATPase RecN
MSGGVDAVAMLVRWTMGEPGADERREDVMALLDEVVHLQAGRDEDTAQLAALADEVARLRAQLEQVRTERDEACVELVRERGDAVALLWACASAANAESRTTAMNLASVATRIERGEHRREEGA